MIHIISVFFNVHGVIFCDFWFVWEGDEGEEEREKEEEGEEDGG